jgi:HipA-like kinase
MQTYRARRVLRADRGGSSWPVLIDTDAGVFYAKLRGAAQAPASLVAEIVVRALADALGLLVPARVFIDIPADLPADDPHEELAELLSRSIGRNLGFQRLPGVRNFAQADVPLVDSDLASRVAWLDGLVQNPDRTAKNPNLLWSHDRLWLIDHGASLGFHHRWCDVTEESPRARGWPLTNHVLQSQATRLPLIDNALATALDRTVLQSAVDAVPDEYLSGDVTEARRRRAAYVAFLWKRLKEPRPFLPALESWPISSRTPERQ